MKATKILAIVILAYAGIVVAFESWLGIAQPTGEQTLVLTTTGADGVQADRVLSRLESRGSVYVAANHWPRAWYRQALADPNVTVSFAGEKKAYLAVPVTDEEHERVNRENEHGILFRILTGFPPREFVRLDPR